MDAHETTGELVKYMDKPLVDFLSRIEKDSSFENTKIILTSDHGQHSSYFKSLFRFNQAILENKLPAMFLIIPNNLYDDKELIINENKTILPYDLYKLFINWSGNEISSVDKGKDIF